MKRKLPYIIAEIGINHQGSYNLAKKLILESKKAGCDAAKFQTFKVETLLQKNTPLAIYQKNKSSETDMYSMLKKLQFNQNQFIKLKEYCDKLKIDFLSTPSDLESAEFLNKLKMKKFKISSADNDNSLLLEKINSFNKPIILSTGMITTSNLIKTIKFLNKNKKNLTILQCISDYPVKLDQSQVHTMNHLKKFGYPVGLSDHTEGEIVSCVAASHGATIIEKHITLDNKLPGPDHEASLETKKLKDFVLNIKTIHELYLKDKGRKLTLNEKKIKIVAKKSLYFALSLKKNTKIKKEHIIPMRPSPKISFKSNEVNKVVGKILKSNVKIHQIISKKNFL